jgi:hypothetical protein
MVRLTRCPDPVVAMNAAVWLKNYADSLIVERARAKPNPDGDKEKLIADLRGLYAKALKAAIDTGGLPRQMSQSALIIR